MKKNTIITLVILALVAGTAFILAKGTNTLSVTEVTGGDCQKQPLDHNGDPINSFDEFRSVSGLPATDAQLQEAGLTVENNQVYDTLCRGSFS